MDVIDLLDWMRSNGATLTIKEDTRNRMVEMTLSSEQNGLIVQSYNAISMRELAAERVEGMIMLTSLELAMANLNKRIQQRPMLKPNQKEKLHANHQPANPEQAKRCQDNEAWDPDLSV